MKKIALIIAIIIAILSVEFYVGFIMGKNSSLVTVKIKNKSSHTISNAMVEFYQGDKIVTNIKKNKTKIARFYSGEKSIYRLKVILDNNQTLFSSSRFVAPGCMLIESVSDTAIKSER